ncbi:MAG: hypothetical protein M1820_003806 [Bogoriella megaspora]|nr:MAG: hypothetical protein M1820_003806 [Bogoriella megaspora]
MPSSVSDMSDGSVSHITFDMGNNSLWQFNGFTPPPSKQPVAEIRTPPDHSIASDISEPTSIFTKNHRFIMARLQAKNASKQCVSQSIATRHDVASEAKSPSRFRRSPSVIEQALRPQSPQDSRPTPISAYPNDLQSSLSEAMDEVFGKSSPSKQASPCPTMPQPSKTQPSEPQHVLDATTESQAPATSSNVKLPPSPVQSDDDTLKDLHSSNWNMDEMLFSSHIAVPANKRAVRSAGATRFVDRSRSTTPSGGTESSMGIDSLKEIEQATTSWRKDGTQALLLNIKEGSRFVPGIAQTPTGPQIAYIPVDSIQIPKEERDIFSGLRDAQKRIDELEKEKARTDRAFHTYEKELVALRLQAQNQKSAQEEAVRAAVEKAEVKAQEDAEHEISRIEQEVNEEVLKVEEAAQEEILQAQQEAAEAKEKVLVTRKEAKEAILRLKAEAEVAKFKGKEFQEKAMKAEDDIIQLKEEHREELFSAQQDASDELFKVQEKASEDVQKARGDMSAAQEQIRTLQSEMTVAKEQENTFRLEMTNAKKQEDTFRLEVTNAKKQEEKLRQKLKRREEQLSAVQEQTIHDLTDSSSPDTSSGTVLIHKRQPSSVDAIDTTIRPCLSPREAISDLLKVASGDLIEAKEKVRMHEVKFRSHDASKGRRVRQELKKEFEVLVAEADKRSEVVYKLHDALAAF